MKRLLSIFFVFSFLVSQGQTRYVLMFEKIGKKKYQYTIGKPIKIKYAGKEKVKGYITWVDENYVIIKDKKCAIDSITHFYTPARWARITSSSLLIAGGGYIALDAFNNSINEKQPIVADYVWKTGGSLIGLGLITAAFRETKHAVKSNWSVKVLIFEERTPPNSIDINE